MEDNLNEVETVESEVTDEEMQSAFDEEWGDTPTENDDFDLSDEPVEEDQDAQPEETETAGETESEGKPEETAEAEPTAEQSEGENQLFAVKVNGEDKQLNLKEMTEYAQKGMDYDRIRQERDNLKLNEETIQKHKAYEAFLSELAQNAGTDIDTLIDGTRARVLMEQAKEKGEDLTEEQALEKAKAVRTKKSEEPEKPSEPDPEEANRKMLLNFIAIYPDVDANSIPKEVWQESAINNDLVGAYQRYENRQLREEIATLKQNQKNKERSAGSRKSAGAKTTRDPFDEGWDDSF